MKNQLPGFALALPSLLVLLGALQGAAPPVEDKTPVPSPDEVAQKLAAYDAAFLSGITVSGSFSSNASLASNLPDKKISFTWGGRLGAMKEEMLPPPYGGPAEGDKHVVLREGKALQLFSEQEAGRLESTIDFLIAPDSTVLQQPAQDNHLVFYRPDSNTLVLPRLRVLWTLGRGIAPYLRKVTEVKRVSPGRLLRVTADGVSMNQTPVRWVLLVDPHLGFLIREAAYAAPNQGPGVLIENSGTEVGDRCVYPQQGTFVIPGMIHYTVKFKSAGLGFDQALYDEVEAIFKGKPPPNTNIHDNRIMPPVFKYVNNKGRVHGEEGVTLPPPSPERRAVIRLFVIVNLLILALFGAFWVYRWRKNREVVAP